MLTCGIENLGMTCMGAVKANMVWLHCVVGVSISLCISESVA